ncbi:Phosphopantothenoylcysteine decarboxylase (EC / Phosphopantothenoylcysteine synthetase (EC [uncultured Gammaproteobacteria bacterium]|nr:Phosphopantothenoylcysteine decarboxylase (EC / Phosphopantothenoylcysteine synthetase (EC [uncultured Gammaproteobacteria bacterium]
MGHIELAKWADAILIAPASANTIANLASGKADDLLSSVILASDCPMLIAPAMNQQMYANSVQANLKTLAEHQVLILAPESGKQAWRYR